MLQKMFYIHEILFFDFTREPKRKQILIQNYVLETEKLSQKPIFIFK